jgi:hypothetical protein
MEAVCSSEISVDFQRITQRYISKDSTLHNHRCYNLKSCYYQKLLITQSIAQSANMIKFFGI